MNIYIDNTVQQKKKKIQKITGKNNFCNLFDAEYDFQIAPSQF